jgi:hypothetical protein
LVRFPFRGRRGHRRDLVAGDRAGFYHHRFRSGALERRGDATAVEGRRVPGDRHPSQRQFFTAIAEEDPAAVSGVDAGGRLGAAGDREIGESRVERFAGGFEREDAGSARAIDHGLPRTGAGDDEPTGAHVGEFPGGQRVVACRDDDRIFEIGRRLCRGERATQGAWGPRSRTFARAVGGGVDRERRGRAHRGYDETKHSDHKRQHPLHFDQLPYLIFGRRPLTQALRSKNP